MMLKALPLAYFSSTLLLKNKKYIKHVCQISTKSLDF